MTTETRLPTDAEVEQQLLARRADPGLDELFGAEAHAELRELARLAHRQRGGARVLILPGIMGSRLGLRSKGGREDVKWFDPVEIAVGGLGKLALPSTRRIEALGVLLFAYLRQKLALRAAGFDADFHAYDWRQSVSDTGRRLAARIDGEPRREVRLVAHSMGGLVARAALAHPGSKKIVRVVQLGTPNLGAFGAVQALRGTYSLVRRLALLDLTRGARELARDVFTTLPGLAELLPPAAECEDFDPFRASDWPRGPRPLAALLAASREALDLLPAPDERFLLIAGAGRDTLTGLRTRDGRLEFRRSDDGDGTVPLRLAAIEGLPTWITAAAHGALPSDRLVTDAVVELLGQGDSTLLPREPPAAARRGRWMAEDDPEPGGEKLFWDDLSAGEQRSFLREFVAGAAAPDRAARTSTGPVELGLCLGSITDVRTEALVLGVFSNVEPAGAAAAVDALLGGAIRDLAERRAIAAAAGEVFMLPAANPELRARYVVLAGLGSFNRYGAEVQRLAAANVTRTLALAGVEDMALVLWGTASGVPPAHAAQAQLAGLLGALSELAPEQRPRRITFVSRSRRRLAAARTAMELVLAASPHAGLARLQPMPAAGVRRPKQPSPAVTPSSYLFLHEHGGELRTALLGPSAKATALAATRRLDTMALDRHLATLAEGLSPESIGAFGERLGELLLPEATRSALASVRESPLVVVHDTAASRWPWETLAVDGWAPAASAGMSRRYAADGMSVAKWREERRLSARLALLLVVNPTEDLPGAADEGKRVLKALDRDDTDVTVLEGNEATRARLLEEFRSGRYDVLHYAGHAFFDAASPAASGILCAGGRVLSGADLASLDALPALVFFNACESGRVRKAGQVLRALGRSTGFAEAFLRGGVANFIGTWWPVSDAAAARFAATLYERLIDAEPIGPAINRARSAIRRLGSADWANYLHYGSFDFALKRRR